VFAASSMQAMTISWESLLSAITMVVRSDIFLHRWVNLRLTRWSPSRNEGQGSPLFFGPLGHLIGRGHFFLFFPSLLFWTNAIRAVKSETPRFSRRRVRREIEYPFPLSPLTNEKRVSTGRHSPSILRDGQLAPRAIHEGAFLFLPSFLLTDRSATEP